MGGKGVYSIFELLDAEMGGILYSFFNASGALAGVSKTGLMNTAADFRERSVKIVEQKEHLQYQINTKTEGSSIR
ncbi:MAG: hypothetical protein GY875_26085 [Gammaproteobacteria bacterium]|nr:hypothetical protein [Gammaproteobacteria bacterium]